MIGTPLSTEQVLARADALRERFEHSLEALVNIPTVSAQPQHKPDILRGVDAAVALLDASGAKAEVIASEREGGNPIVVGRLGSEPSLPTITIYNHLDVQPADREADGWTTDPFVMQIDGERYRGRGATDDKGPAIAALLGGLLARERGLRANLQFLWEFEEEIGSPSFESTIARHGDRLATSSVVVSDTIWVSRERPAAPAGLRGLQGILLRLRTGERDEHSGVTGGAARNPLAELMAVVCDCFDPSSGKVQIPGFYDEVIPPTNEELEGFLASGFDVARFKKDHRFASLRTEDPVEVMKRIWALPTFEVHGVVGGYSGVGLKTVIPPFAEVKLSCRLVPGMTGQKTFDRVSRFIRSRHPDVEVLPEHRLEPYRGQTTGPLADAIRGAIEFGFGARPVFVREGGSIGAVVSMEKVLRCPVMFLGLSLPEHGYHAPNEYFDWGQARGGMAAFYEYFRRLSA